MVTTSIDRIKQVVYVWIILLGFIASSRRERNSFVSATPTPDSSSSSPSTSSSSSSTELNEVGLPKTYNPALHSKSRLSNSVLNLSKNSAALRSFKFNSPPFSSSSSSTPRSSSSSKPSYEPSIQDLTLSPLVLVVTVDGHVHALKRETGDWIWTLHDDQGVELGGKSNAVHQDVPFGSPLIKNSRRRTSVNTTYNNDDNNNNSNSEVKTNSTTSPLTKKKTTTTGGGNSSSEVPPHEDEGELYVIEPTAGGEIYLYDKSRSKDGSHVELEKLPLSMQELVALSPFTFPSDNSRMFMGGSNSKIVAVDLRTGRLVGVFGSGGKAWCEWDPEKLGVKKPDLECEDDIERRPQDLLYMGRTEYTLSIYSKSSSIPLQTLTYTTYTSSALGISLQSQWTHTPDNRYLQPMHDGSLVCFQVGVPGYTWSMAFDTPVVSVFDIALPAATTEHGEDPNREFDPPLMFEQPHPLLVEGLPVDFDSWQRLPDTAFVGRVGDDLFAMSRDRYPLIALAPNRNTLGPNEEREGIEAGQGVEEGEGDETRARGCEGLDCLLGRFPVADSHIAPVGPDSAIDPPKSRLLLDGPNPTASSTPTSPHRPSPPIPTRSSVLASLSSPITSLSSGSNNGIVVVFLLAVLAYFYAKKLSNDKGSTNVIGQTVNSIKKKKAQASMTAIKTGSDRSTPLRKTEEKVTPIISVPVSSSDQPSTQSNGHLPAFALSTPTIKTPLSPNGTTPLSPTSSKELPPLPPPEEELDSDVETGPSKDGTPRKKSRRRRGKKHKKLIMTGLGLHGELGNGGGLGGSGMDDAGELGNITLSEAEIKDGGEDEDGEVVQKIVGGGDPTSVGNLSVSDTILGYGSHGTVVLKGEFQGRAVAVKRLLKDFVTIATHEVALLQESDDHPHVIRYYCKEQRDTFLYIALELCPASLFDLIDQPSTFPELVQELDPKRALRQITSGIRHLHKLKIVHRDIKPQNILVSTSKHGGVRMLISDFGLCKKLDVDESSFQQTMNHAAGSFGYRAPEVLRGLVDPEQEALINTPSHSTNGSPTHVRGNSSSSSTGLLTDPSMRLTRSIDIFSLGCIVYYVLTGGEHPFGGRYEREMNILQGKISLERLDGLGEEAVEVQDLITRMVATDPRERPTAEAVLLHPFFWNAQKRLLFICDASDRFEIMERDPPTPTLQMLESRATEIVGDDWQKAIDRNLLDNLGKYRKYDGRSVRDLLRVLRNKKHHYQDLPDNVRKNLGPLPGGFLSYFTLRFPHLLLHVYDTVATHLRDEPMFASTFRIPDEEQ